MTEHSAAAIAAFPDFKDIEFLGDGSRAAERAAFDLGAAHTLAANREEIARALFFLELPGEDRLWDEHRSHVGDNAHLWCTIPVYFARADAILASGVLVDVRKAEADALEEAVRAYEKAFGTNSPDSNWFLQRAAELRKGRA